MAFHHQGGFWHLDPLSGRETPLCGASVFEQELPDDQPVEQRLPLDLRAKAIGIYLAVMEQAGADAHAERIDVIGNQRNHLADFARTKKSRP